MSGLSNFITDYRRKNRPHSHSRPYSQECIFRGCRTKPYFDGETYFTLCKDHLRKEELGPFKQRIHKDDYSTLFWLSDYENKYTN